MDTRLKTRAHAPMWTSAPGRFLTLFMVALCAVLMAACAGSSSSTNVLPANVPPAIVGTTWTPAKDASGRVIDGDWAGLPLNTWLYADVPAMSSVVETPRYTASSGSDGSINVTDAWGGAAWDYVNQKMFLFGGGHGDSSACETGMYSLDVASLTWARVRDRDPKTELGYWTSGMVWVGGVEAWAGGQPLLSGQPSAVHTYHGIVWVPPAVMVTLPGGAGNTSGGVYIPGPTKVIYDLDAKAYTPTHYSMADAPDPSDVAAFIDGAGIYGPHHYYDVYRWDLTQTETSLWGPNSLGKFTRVYAGEGLAVSSNSVWGWIRERREHFGFYAYSGLPKTRVRYGAALDAGETNWAPYSDDITLTSTDGSHLDFNNANLMTGGDLYGAGSAYDPDTETLYIQGSVAGNLLYKITGIASNTWASEKIAGTGVLTTAVNGTFGRLRMATLGGKKVLVRVSSTLDKPQVMRIR